MTRSSGRPSTRRPPERRREPPERQREPPERGREPALHGLESLEALGRRMRADAERRAAERERLEREQRQREREANVFLEAVADVVPLAPTGRIDPHRRQVPATALQREIDERAALAASLSDEIDIDRHLETDESLSYRRGSVGPDVPRRLRRGEWAIRGQIDLHGLRVDQAREALAAFLDEALRREWRCVRVIHGKGLGSIGREPVLKAKVPRWLAQRREVLAFCQARPNDGGAGALIVLLQ